MYEKVVIDVPFETEEYTKMKEMVLMGKLTQDEMDLKMMNTYQIKGC